MDTGGLAGLQIVDEASEHRWHKCVALRQLPWVSDLNLQRPPSPAGGVVRLWDLRVWGPACGSRSCQVGFECDAQALTPPSPFAVNHPSVNSFLLGCPCPGRLKPA